MDKKTRTLLLAAAAVVILLAAGLIISLHKTSQARQDMAEMEEMIAFEKEQLQDEYEDLAMQYDGYAINLSNDSLVTLLAQEQQHVRDLLEELRTTKATNARRISELKKELATVRAVMVQYVHQIDSLSQTNRRLADENRQVRRQYEEVSQQATQLQQEKEQLTSVVQRASMMEVSGFALKRLNDKNRETTRYNKIAKLQIDFTVLKNITTEAGMKTVYLRIVRPDGEVLTKSASHLFSYENKQIAYSLRQEFEYAGEAVSQTLYWRVEEMLPAGTYNCDFFIDGNLVGSFPFRIEK